MNCGIGNYYFYDRKVEEILGTFELSTKFNFIKLLKKKLEDSNNKSFYNNIFKLFDNLRKKYSKELEKF